MKSIDCPHCLQEWADWMEWQRETDELEHEARLADLYEPATDREYREHLAACYGDPEETVVDWELALEEVS